MQRVAWWGKASFANPLIELLLKPVKLAVEFRHVSIHWDAIARVGFVQRVHEVGLVIPELEDQAGVTYGVPSATEGAESEAGLRQPCEYRGLPSTATSEEDPQRDKGQVLVYDRSDGLNVETLN